MDTYSLLEQDRLWRSADGMMVALDHMTHEHRTNTLAFLRRNAAFTMRAYYWCLDNRFAHTWGLEQAQMSMSQLEIDGDAEEWIDRRPLIVRLAHMVASEDVIDVEVVPTADQLTRQLARRRRAIEATARQAAQPTRRQICS